MNEIAQDIVNVIGDYHNDHGFQFTTENVLEWVNQFDMNDRQFVLEEFRHVLNQDIYVSKSRAAELMRRSLAGMSQHFRYATIRDFLIDTRFLNLQPAPKSQGELLLILDHVLQQDYNLNVGQCGVNNPKNFVYYDDLLGTGGTISRITNSWLSSNHQNGQPNFTLVNNGQIRFILCVFCSHSWGLQTCKWLWKYRLNNDEIMKSVIVFHHFNVENQVGIPSERLNLLYPNGTQPQNVHDYVRELPTDAVRHESRAFRMDNQPIVEGFFSTPANRIRFENILLQKGIEI